MSVLSDEQETPQRLFDELNVKYGPFDLDAAASTKNFKCSKYYTERDDAMQIEVWAGDRIWLNPPYSRRSKKTGSYGLYAWVQKAWFQAMAYGKRVVLLLPADTSTKWFHDYVLGREKMSFPKVTHEFLKGRLNFNGAECGAKFGSVVVVFDGLV